MNVSDQIKWLSHYEKIKAAKAAIKNQFKYGFKNQEELNEFREWRRYIKTQVNG